MQTKSVLDAKSVVVAVSLVALVALAVWSIGLWLTSTQSLQNQVNDLVAQKNSLQTQVTSLQNQVTGLQNQVASLNTQLAAKQTEIEELEALVTVYRIDIEKLLQRAYPYQPSGPTRFQIQ